jgi:hypothetical protein
MPTNTFVPIQTYTLSTTQTSITFNSIPNTYQDLVIIGRGIRTIANSGSNNVRMWFNGDTGSNYNYSLTYGAGSSYSSNNVYGTNAPAGGSVGDPNQSGNFNFIQIINYKSTNVKKSWFNNVLNALGDLRYDIAGNWETSNAAISSIELNVNGAEGFAANTQFTLYGR